MKKKLLLGLLAAAAVSFTACQKNEVISEMPQDNAISFNTYLGRGAQTKGSIVEQDQLKTQGFGVFAYYTGTTAADGYTFPATPNFMNNVQVTHKDWNQAEDENPNNNTWGYAPIKYWPNTPGDKISFYAYGPYNGTGINIMFAKPATPRTPAPPVLVYMVDTDYANHTDVLFAPAQLNKTKGDRPVNFDFQHALSRVEFSVKTDIDYSSTATIKLQSVALKAAAYSQSTNGFYDMGYLDLSKESVNWECYNRGIEGWNIEDTEEVTSRPRRVGSESEYIMIIPQDFTGNSDNLSLTVSYNVQYGQDAPITNTITKNDIGINFEQGKAYKINIIVGLNAVTFDASVTEWDENHSGFNPGTDVTI